MKTPKGPFLQSSILAMSRSINIDGISMSSRELLEWHRALGGNLVVSDGLRSDLKKSFFRYVERHGHKPDAVRHQAFMEYLFIPVEWDIIQAPAYDSEVGPIETGNKMLLFFAVPRKF